MIATTPSGTRTRWIRRPLGRTQPSMTSPTGSGSAGDLAQPGGHRLRAGRRSSRRRSTTVARCAAGLGRGDVVGVGREDLGVAVDQQVGGGEQGGVLGRGGGGGQDPAGRLGPGPELGDGVDGHPASVRGRPAGGRLWTMTTAHVRPASATDVPGIAEALALSFHDDPVMAWLFGDDEDRTVRRPPHVHRPRGGPPPRSTPTCYTTDDHAGAALLGSARALEDALP